MDGFCKITFYPSIGLSPNYINYYIAANDSTSTLNITLNKTCVDGFYQLYYMCEVLCTQVESLTKKGVG